MIKTLEHAIEVAKRNPKGEFHLPAAVRRFIKRQFKDWQGWNTPAHTHESYFNLKKLILQKSWFSLTDKQRDDYEKFCAKRDANKTSQIIVGVDLASDSDFSAVTIIKNGKVVK